jgi:hypothetical protein
VLVEPDRIAAGAVRSRLSPKVLTGNVASIDCCGWLLHLSSCGAAANSNDAVDHLQWRASASARKAAMVSAKL